MHVRFSTKKRNGKTYRYPQLVQSYRRKDGMPAHRVIASLKGLSEVEIDNIRNALKASRKGRRVVVDQDAAKRLPARPVLANLRYLDLVVCLNLWNRWGLTEIITRLTGDEATAVPSADIIAALALQRCVESSSKLAAAERWFARTALPELLALTPNRFNNTRIHRALATLEALDEPLQAALARRLPAKDGPYQALFVDVTDTWFVGHGPEAAQNGKTKEGMVRRKIGLVLLCDQRGYPIRWQVIPGKRPDGKAMLDMIAKVANLGWAARTPLVCDRSMGKACYVEALIKSDLHFLTAIPVTEFATYTNHVPHHALADLEVHDRDDADKDALDAAAAAVRDSGMRQVSERLLVLDLGLLHPFGRSDDDRGDAQPLSDVQVAASSARAELRLGLLMKAERDQGRSYSHIGRLHGCTKQRAASLVYLTELNEEAQEVVLQGRAEQVSQRELLRIRRLPAPQQLEALEAAIKEAARGGTRAKRRKAAGGKKAKGHPKAAGGPIAAPVRAVLYFNPELFVRRRRTALRRLAAVDEAVADLNRRLASPQSHRSKESILGETSRLLRANDLLSVFETTLSTEEHNGRTRFRVELRLDDKAWAKRRRFDGFSLLIGHAELRQSPEALVQLYRAKDQVEKDFQLVKSPIIAIRPVRHRTDPKVRAHVTLCMLALLLQRTLERRLAEAGLDHTAYRALEELAPCHLNQLALEAADEPVFTLTRLTDTQSQLLAALEMSELGDDQEIAANITPR